jgi:MFS family permease
MMSCLGAGAIVAALQFPRWRERFDRDQFVRFGTMAHAVLSTLVVALPTPWIVLPAVALLGAAWISTANSLVLSAQQALPNWVRARGMSIYQMALMGGTAIGAGLWGQVAGWTSVPAAVVAAALAGVCGLYLTRRWSVEGGGDEDLSPQPPRPVTGVSLDIAPDEGPVMVVIEYRIDPARARDFAQVMQATRRARLRQGALSWGLFKDAGVPGRYVESFVDENWVEHLRRHERFTAADDDLRLQRLAFHLGPEPPVVKRYVAETLAAAPAVPV